MKAAFTQVYFILLLPPSSPLSSPLLQISCASFGLYPLCGHNSLWSGFLTCVQIGKLQDGELSLVRFMWSQGACGRWRVRDVLVVGVGQSKEDISPACSGLTLLTLTAWLTLTAAVIWKGPQCCAALGGLLPSHPSFVSVFPFMLFFLSLPPPPHLHQRPGGFIVYGREAGDSQTNPLHPTYPPSSKHSLSHPPRPDRGRRRPPAWCSWPGWGWCFRAGCWDEQHDGVIVTGHGQAKAASTSLCLVHPVDPPGKNVSLQGNRKPLWSMGFLGK